MKILLLLITALVSTFMKDGDAKKYTKYVLAFIGLLMPVVSLFLNLEYMWISFESYEYIPWITFWISFLILTIFDKVPDIHEFLLPLILALAILDFQLGIYNFLALEILFIWNLLKNEKNIHSSLELQYFLKLMLTIFIIFSNDFDPEASKWMLNILMLGLIVYVFIHTIFFEKFFYYFYLINLIALGNYFAAKNGFDWMYATYFVTTLIGLRFIYLTVIWVGKIPALIKRFSQVEKIKVYLRLKLYNKASINYFPSLQKVQTTPRTIVFSRKFSNDLASSIFITFFILLLFVSIFLYRLN